MCLNETLARYARQHNGANVLALGATLVNTEQALAIVDTFLDTPMRELATSADWPRFATSNASARLMGPVDLERLIQIIVEEMAAAGGGRAPVRCSCHSVLYECCPDRVAARRRSRRDPARVFMRRAVAPAAWRR